MYKLPNIFLQVNLADITSEIGQILTSGSVSVAFDWTFIISVIIVVFGIVTTIVQLFGPSLSVKDETLRKSEYLNEFKNTIKNELKEMENSYDEKLESTSDFLIERINATNDLLEEKVKTLNSLTSKHENKIDVIKEDISKIKENIIDLKYSYDNNTKSVENIRFEQRKLIERIDNVLRQILELVE